jgi:hypothetical protein
VVPPTSHRGNATTESTRVGYPTIDISMSHHNVARLSQIYPGSSTIMIPWHAFENGPRKAYAHLWK